MNVRAMMAELDAEIVRLTRVRKVLGELGQAEIQSGTRRGRPPGRGKARSAPAAKRAGMSEEGRRRVAEAQRKRWAAQKKASQAANKPAPARKSIAKAAPAHNSVASTSKKSRRQEVAKKKATSAKARKRSLAHAPAKTNPRPALKKVPSKQPVRLHELKALDTRLVETSKQA